MRILFLLHRYLGIAVGIVLTVWCLSGFVLLYVPYPGLSPAAAAGLAAPLRLDTCCALPDNPGMAAVPFTHASLEMLDAATPVLRAGLPQARALNIDLRRGVEFDSTQVLGPQVRIAEDFSQRYLDGAAFTGPEKIQQDQWTITALYHPHRPLWKYTAQDAAGTQWYVSDKSGEIVLVTRARERLWNYLGAVPHWFYPTVLRQHLVAWSQTVIWLSLLGGFLTLTGLIIGVRQFQRRRRGRVSPYRGLGLWHHLSGLVFGIVTLLWVASGTVSMNPWGLLEGEGAGDAPARLQGDALHWSDIRTVLARVRTLPLPADTVSLDMVKQAGQLWVMRTDAQGQRTRLDPQQLAPAPISGAELALLADALQGRATLLQQEDAYYYSVRETLSFPVLRVEDEAGRLFYLSGQTGELLRVMDRDARAYRWFFTGLHSGDFLDVLRARPLWDVVMLLFLTGTTLVCATGSWMAWRRIRPG